MISENNILNPIKKIENENSALKARESYEPINPAMPARVVIATTDACNLKCPMCISAPHNVHFELPFETFKKLAKETFPSAKEYHLGGSGEPLLTSYFVKIPSIVSHYGMKMSIITNGMLLTEDVSKLIMPVLRDVKVSFDGATKETFEKIRPGSNYETIIKNIKDFIKVRGSIHSKSEITLQTTLMYDNIKEFPNIIQIGHELGVDRIKACFMRALTKEMVSNCLWFHKKLANKQLEKAEELAEDYDIRVMLPKRFNLEENYINKEKGSFCHYLWEEIWIEVNGDVKPCCHRYAPLMGNVNKTPIKKIWNNKIYQEMRKRLKDNPPNYCKTCALVNEFKSHDWNYSRESLILIKSDIR
jgi:radical SAM protein with 4Fe4S-binding SPASM domain